MQNTLFHYAVWSEFSSFRDLILHLETLRQNNCSLYLAIHRSSFRDKELYHLMNVAKELGVEVRPWPLLDKDQGYWPNKWNLPEFEQFIFEFHQECLTNGLHPGWIIMDLEPHIGLMLELEQLMQKNLWLKARKLLLKWGTEMSWQTSKAEMQNLVNKIHGLGLKVQVVTMPMVLDDMISRTVKLQHWLGIPVEGINWDEVTFMTYRPYFWDYLPQVSSRIVYSYAQDAYRLFGERASLAIGPVGSPGITQSKHFYRKGEDLQMDVQAGGHSGIKRFSLFCLEGINEQGDLPDFIKSRPESFSSSFDWRSKLIRLAIKLGLWVLSVPD